MQQYSDVLAALRQRAMPIAAVVAQDLAGTHDAGTEPLQVARAAVDWLLAELRAGDRVRPASLEGKSVV